MNWRLSSNIINLIGDGDWDNVERRLNSKNGPMRKEKKKRFEEMRRKDILLLKQPDEKGRLPMHLACIRADRSNLKALKSLLEAHPESVKHKDNEGATPIHMLFTNGTAKSTEFVKLLITEYPDACSSRDNFGRTPIFHLVHSHLASYADKDFPTFRLMFALEQLFRQKPALQALRIPCGPHENYQNPRNATYIGPSHTFPNIWNDRIERRTPLYMMWSYAVKTNTDRLTGKVVKANKKKMKVALLFLRCAYLYEVNGAVDFGLRGSSKKSRRLENLLIKELHHQNISPEAPDREGSIESIHVTDDNETDIDFLPSINLQNDEKSSDFFSDGELSDFHNSKQLSYFSEGDVTLSKSGTYLIDSAILESDDDYIDYNERPINSMITAHEEEKEEINNGVGMMYPCDCDTNADESLTPKIIFAERFKDNCSAEKTKLHVQTPKKLRSTCSDDSIDSGDDEQNEACKKEANRKRREAKKRENIGNRARRDSIDKGDCTPIDQAPNSPRKIRRHSLIPWKGTNKKKKEAKMRENIGNRARRDSIDSGDCEPTNQVPNSLSKIGRSSLILRKGANEKKREAKKGESIKNQARRNSIDSGYCEPTKKAPSSRSRIGRSSLIIWKVANGKKREAKKRESIKNRACRNSIDSGYCEQTNKAPSSRSRIGRSSLNVWKGAYEKKREAKKKMNIGNRRKLDSLDSGDDSMGRGQTSSQRSANQKRREAKKKDKIENRARKSKVNQRLHTKFRIIHAAVALHQWLPCEDILRMTLRNCPHQLTKREARTGYIPLHLAIIKDAGHAIIKKLIECNKDTARIRTNNGQLPLHLALAQKSHDMRTIRIIFKAYPDAIKERDSRTKLYSFMIPAVSEEVRCLGTVSDSCQQSLASYDEQNSADNLEAAGKIFELLML